MIDSKLIRWALYGAILAVVLVVLMLTAGCGDTLSQGTVTGKEFHPAHNDVMLMPIQTGNICSTSGGTYPVTTCTPIYTYIPYNVYVPDQWVFKLEDCDDSGKCKKGHAYVDKGTYEATAVGKYWSKVPGFSKPNPPVRLSRAAKKP
jgi:hypothetical protein